MIYGESDAEWRERTSAPHEWFAWFPVRLIDGRRAWLESVSRVRQRSPPPFPSYWIYNEKGRSWYAGMIDQTVAVMLPPKKP